MKDGQHILQLAIPLNASRTDKDCTDKDCNVMALYANVERFFP